MRMHWRPRSIVCTGPYRVMWCMCAQANNPGGGPIYYDLLSVVVRCLLHVVVALCR